MITMSLQQKDKKYLWHPYTQMHDYASRDLLLIDRAEGLMLYDKNGKSYYDTISSWWCILHGHNHHTQITQIAGPEKPVPVVGAAAASRTPDGGTSGGSYNLYRIESRGGQFTCTMSERGARHVGGRVETLVQQRLGDAN